MRLSLIQQNCIKSKALEIFGKDCNVFIFGSRIDNNKRGGDIDIYIEANVKNILDSKIKYVIELEKNLGEQKIDVIVNNGTLDKDIFRIAKQGVKL